MSNWIIPQSAWLTRITSGFVLQTVELSGVQGEQTQVPTSKAIDALFQIVNEVRGAIAIGNRTPLSATTQTVGDLVIGSVPPEGVRKTLLLVVEVLVNSIPNMSFSISAQMQKDIDAAKDWVEKLSEGKPCTYPTDPILLDASGNPVGMQVGGRLHPEPWLGTEELKPNIVQPCVQPGQTVYSGTSNPNGVQIGNAGDYYNQFLATGELIQIWQMGGVSGTNVGWLPYVF